MSKQHWVLIELLPGELRTGPGRRIRPPFGRYYTQGFIPLPFAAGTLHGHPERPIPTWLAQLLFWLIAYVGVRLADRVHRFYGFDS